MQQLKAFDPEQILDIAICKFVIREGRGYRQQKTGMEQTVWILLQHFNYPATITLYVIFFKDCRIL